MCSKITESKKMELSLIHEILPPEMIEKILKLLNYKGIYQSKLVCRRWKVIIDMGNLLKRAEGETLPPEMVEKILKLLNCKDIYQSQMVCRRWKEIIDMGNLTKKVTGNTSTLPVPLSF